MKSTSLLVILVIALSLRLTAQDDGVPTFSQDCYSAAKQRAADTIAGPVLTGMGTFPIKNAPFFGSSRFMLQTAKATAWLYTFRSSINNTGAAILTYKSKATGSCVAIELPIDTSKISPYPINENQIHSDSLMLELATNNTFLSILNQHNELQGDSLFVVSSNADGSNTFPPDVNLWITDFAYNGGKLICVYDATTKTKSICQNVAATSVDLRTESNQIMCLPAPASSYAVVHIPSIIQNSIRTIDVYNINGVSVMDMRSMASSINSGVIIIPVSKLEDGMYTVRVQTSTTSLSAPLIVSH